MQQVLPDPQPVVEDRAGRPADVLAEERRVAAAEKRGVWMDDRLDGTSDLDAVASRAVDPTDSTASDEGGPPGQTSTANLVRMCRLHHRVKTHGDWQYERDASTGLLTWTSPLGRVYTVHEHGTLARF